MSMNDTNTNAIACQLSYHTWLVSEVYPANMPEL